MKKIVQIARTELQTLFYSPIAWLILVIFAVQTALVFTEGLDKVLKNQLLGQQYAGLTTWIFQFEAMLSYLYAYMPLLTMGLISRELSTGSIKLLYSSPITNTQIILGKFVAMMLYGLALVGLLAAYAVFGEFAIKDVDTRILLTALLGVYLLVCAYAAIGLFMSCLTSYQVVAAIGTLALLAALKYVSQVGQSLDFVRDITYWLSIGGRANSFLHGLINSEDVLYFLIVITFFLVISILKLDATKHNRPALAHAGRFGGALVVALLLGYLSSRPPLMAFYDASRTKINTLTPNSQAIVGRMDGGLTITTYVNLFDRDYYRGMPELVNIDKENLKQYLRFKPDTKLRYVYYYHQSDNPASTLDPAIHDDRKQMERIAAVQGLDPAMFLSPTQIARQVDLAPEHYHFVRQLERANGQKTFLRIYHDLFVHPGEREVSAALKRLTMKLPRVGFLTGQGERSSSGEADRQYYRLANDVSYREALINQGFDVQDVRLATQGVPADVSILVIADMQSALGPAEAARLDQYLSRGGNLLVLGGPGRQAFMNPVVAPLGVRFLPGQLVQPTPSQPAGLVTAQPTPAALALSDNFKAFSFYHAVATLPNATALAYQPGKGYQVRTLFAADPATTWNELQTHDFTDAPPTCDPAAGEQRAAFPVLLALARRVAGKEQRIAVVGSADCFSSGELAASRKDVNSANNYLISGLFYWLSDGEVPIDVQRPPMPDDQLTLSLAGAGLARYGFVGLLPLLLAGLGVGVWWVRKGR